MDGFVSAKLIDEKIYKGINLIKMKHGGRLPRSIYEGKIPIFREEPILEKKLSGLVASKTLLR
jgi:hypothetical protein